MLTTHGAFQLVAITSKTICVITSFTLNLRAFLSVTSRLLYFLRGVDALSPFLQVELVYYIFGRHKFPGATTANLERFVRHFNVVQHWVVTELCLCEDLVKRAILLKKFIKIASV